VADLMKSAVKQAMAPLAAIAAQLPADAAKPSILVVEDSITSRALLKNILEAAGYRVATAVDGIDAYTALKTATFDLVVSDVEMPRMDGFYLTAKVRADKHLAELPIVLVTALGSREHRERGIDAGANAYIVKSSFDQSNLLETVQRLIS
jgi:two-component system chemotaxis sensor kinase CheA